MHVVSVPHFWQRTQIAFLSSHDDAFGAIILNGDGLRLTADFVALFQDVNPFGFILSARYIDTPDQVRALCDDYREAGAWEYPIRIDQEVGRVQRLRSPTWRNWMPPWT
jgi:beta-N-acetylhexosaminidase